MLTVIIKIKMPRSHLASAEREAARGLSSISHAVYGDYCVLVVVPDLGTAAVEVTFPPEL